MANNPIVRVNKKFADWLKQQSKDKGKNITNLSEEVFEDYIIMKKYIKAKKKEKDLVPFKI
tara:strand:+ start:1208 stop:1390 length:183 start_codon:yes stop_codon:yes gene_type:complete